MNKNGVLNEYKQILDIFEDLLVDGYHHPHSKLEIQAQITKNKFITSPSVEINQFNLDITKKSNTKQSLTDVSLAISNCKKCNLHLTRENTVPGIGSKEAKLMIICAWPAYNATAKSYPLPKPEMDYLKKWLEALDLNIENDVYITPAVKCRTPGRPPNINELACCVSWFHQQYLQINPVALIALGNTACTLLTGDSGMFAQMVGKINKWNTIPSLVLWSPAEVLANPHNLKRPVWEALKKLKTYWHAIPEDRL